MHAGGEDELIRAVLPERGDSLLVQRVRCILERNQDARFEDNYRHSLRRVGR